MQSKQIDKPSEFIELLQTNKGILYKVARSYCNSEEERKDLIQEITFHVWKAFPNYDDKFKFSTWLFRIALNVAISYLRKETKRKKINEAIQVDLIELTNTKEDPIDHQIGILYASISELNAFDKALMLLYLDENSYREIAEIMGISESNVATKISRIKKVIKEKFQKLNQL
ncbi:sigma-70 family RNA polymerase sigma factor [Algoriphagus halophilus]|uniref:RNA polymerase sigma factor n=1 Tax=Algoriphagus halophilus TaxID=226505 RepID=UPI00358EA8E0